MLMTGLTCSQAACVTSIGRTHRLKVFICQEILHKPQTLPGLKVSVDSIFQEWKQRLLLCFLPAALPLLFHTPASSVESGRLTVNKHPPPSHTLCSFNLIYF
ncbi:unnamed protein product [Arctogadus glacialis]